jgi:uracil-DNA glycosylase
MLGALPESWQRALGEESGKPYFKELSEFVEQERERGPVYPPREEVFAALDATPYDQVKVLILGQDPYHGEGQGHGLCFSVRPGVRTPPSLRNIYKELRDDLGHPVPDNGFLMPWAEQGVLLLNAVLTVQMGVAASHQGRGWEKFTDAVIRLVNAKPEPVVFMLWGSHAQKKAAFVDSIDRGGRHLVLKSVHPSPLSAYGGFFGSKPFSKANTFLESRGMKPIDWRLPEKA